MKPLSLIVRTICNISSWFMLVYGFYVIIHGHLTPGGGFQGGAVVATFMALLFVAHGRETIFKWVKPTVLSFIESGGLIVFWTAGMMGIATTFFYNFLAKSGGLFGSNLPNLGPNAGALNTSGTIAVMNLAVGFEVIAGISLILIFMMKGISMSAGGERGHDK